MDDDGLFGVFREEWTGLLNEMGMDMSVSGHQHRIYQFLPGAVEAGTTLVYTEGYSGKVGKVEGSYLTDFRFPTFLVARRSLQQSGGTSDNHSEYMCLYTSVDFRAGVQVSTYINSDGETVTGYYPFVGEYPSDSFTDIETPIQRPE